jgi:hypothetical protein
MELISAILVERRIVFVASKPHGQTYFDGFFSWESPGSFSETE